VLDDADEGNDDGQRKHDVEEDQHAVDLAGLFLLVLAWSLTWMLGSRSSRLHAAREASGETPAPRP